MTIEEYLAQFNQEKGLLARFVSEKGLDPAIALGIIEGWHKQEKWFDDARQFIPLLLAATREKALELARALSFGTIEDLVQELGRLRSSIEDLQAERRELRWLWNKASWLIWR